MNAPRIPVEAKPPRMERLARLPVFFALRGKRAVVAGGTRGRGLEGGAALGRRRGGRRVRRRGLGRDAGAGGRSAAVARSCCICAPGRRTILPAPPWRSARSSNDDEAARFAAAARAAGVPVNVIDKPAFCDFSFGSIVNRSPLVIGISTDGAAPVFAQAIRAKLEALIPRASRAGRRPRGAGATPSKSSGLPFAGRRRFWQMFTATALREPDRRARTRPTSIASSPRRRPKAKQPSAARSRWSAPAPAIRSC